MDLLEKMDLLDVVDEGLTTLKNGVQDLLEKMDWLDKVDEALSKLNASVKKSDSLLDKLLAGEFISATPKKFKQVLIKVWNQIKSNVVIIHKPLIDFLNTHKDDMILESAEINIADINTPEKLKRLLETIKLTGFNNTIMLKIN